MSHKIDSSNLKSSTRQFGGLHFYYCYIAVLGKEKYVSKKQSYSSNGPESFNQLFLTALFFFGGVIGKVNDPFENPRKAKEVGMYCLETCRTT